MSALFPSPGRLLISCIEAQHVRSRVENDSDSSSLAPYVIFQLKSKSSDTPLKLKCKNGKNRGHDVDFEGDVVAFDLASPEEFLYDDNVALSVQLQDDSENAGLIGEAQLSIIEILSSETEFVREVAILRPGDFTTNTLLKLKLFFIKARTGMLKLYTHQLVSLGIYEDLCIKATTPDGQSNNTPLKEISAHDSLNFWIDSNNWFGTLVLQIYREGERDESIQLEPLSLIDFGAKGRGEVSSSVQVSSWNIGSKNMTEMSNIDLHHEFMEAARIRIESIDISHLPQDATSNPSDIRVILKTKGKTHRNEHMTIGASIMDSKLHWTPSINLPVVDEYTLFFECCEYDDIAKDYEEVGMGKVSLLPLFRDGRIDTKISLKHLTELGDALDAGVLRLIASFDPPKNVAFPQDQPTMTSYVYVTPEDREERKNMQPLDDDQDGVFTEEDIKKAFSLFDLDSNGYIGAAEVRHILIFMGEHVTDEEVDMMISMLDKNGDGQVSFKEFKAMVEADDPSQEDFLSQQYNKQAIEPPSLSVEAQQRNNLTAKKLEVFARCIRTCNIDTFAVARMWDILRSKAYADPTSKVNSSNFHVQYDGFCELMPVFSSTSESHVIYDLLRGGASSVDGRELIMSFSGFVNFTSEDKCRLVFDMYDDDRSGYLSLDEIEAIMMSTHLKSREVIQKRALTLMKSADSDNSGDITIDELIVAAEKFPNLLFPNHTKKAGVGQW